MQVILVVRHNDFNFALEILDHYCSIGHFFHYYSVISFSLLVVKFLFRVNLIANFKIYNLTIRVNLLIIRSAKIVTGHN